MMKKLLSLVLALMFVLAAPLASLAEDAGENSAPVEEATQAPVQEVTPAPTQAPVQEPAPAAAAEPTQEPVQDPTEEPAADPTEEPAADPTEEPAADPTEEPETDPTEEPEADPTEEPETDPTEEPEADPTEEPEADPTEEPAADPAALPAPANLSWSETGDISFDTVTPETVSYLVTIFLNGEMVKDIPMNDVPQGTTSLTIPAEQVLGEAGEYTFAVVALGFGEWLDSEAALSDSFQYIPEDPYAGLDPISTLVAMVEAGELTIQEARSAFFAMSARDVEDLLLEIPEAVDALGALEALYMQAEEISLDAAVSGEVGGAKLTGAGLNAWGSPQALQMGVTSAPKAEKEGALALSFALEAIQNEPNPPEAHPGASIAPVYVTLPTPEDFSSREAALTGPQGENVAFKVKEGRVCFVISSLGAYEFANWIPVVEEVPVLTVPLGAFLIIPDALDALAIEGAEPWAWQPPEVNYLLEVLNAPSVSGEAWVSEAPDMVVALQNGVVSVINLGETIVTRTNADGEETKVILKVTPVDPLDVRTPYSRVLPAGSLKPAVALNIAPAYGINKYSALHSSDVSDRNRVTIGFSQSGGVNIVTVSQTTRIPNRAFEKFAIRNSIGWQIPLSARPAYSGSPAGYTTSFALPAQGDGKYSLMLFADMASGYDMTDFIFNYYVENGKAYFANEYADSCNQGVLAMLQAGTVPDDIGTLLVMGNDPANVTARNLIQNKALELTAGGSQYTKALAIYQWIADNITYDTSLRSGDPYYTYTARRGTGDGFATLATLMLHYAGIKSVSVIGYGGNDPSNAGLQNNHQWNAVQIDGAWRFMDAAWDAGAAGTVNANTYEYFLPSSQYLSFNHRAAGLGITGSSLVTAVTPKDLEPIEAFVNRLYSNVMGRPADVDGLIYWRDALASGSITGGYACGWFYTGTEFSIETNPMTDTQFIENLYNTCMGRSSDAGGMAYWLSMLNAGATRTSVMNWFIGSPEFLGICQSYGITRGSYTVNEYRHKDMNVTIFVSRMHKLLLGRTVNPKVNDVAALESWCRGLILKTTNGTSLVVALANSAEFAAYTGGLSDSAYVSMVYEACYGYAPSAQSLIDWTRYLAAGATRASILNVFLASAEFGALCQAAGIVRGSYVAPNYRDRNPLVTSFVARMYRLFLSREPDVNGVEYWCKVLLLNQQTGSQVASGFVNSAEFRGRPLSDSDYVEIMYNGLMGRTSDAVGKAYWIGEIALKGRSIIFNGFIVSPEWRAIMTSYGIR